MDSSDLLINLNETTIETLCEPLMQAPLANNAWPMPNIFEADNNPFDRLAHCSDENDPFECVFNTAKTYSPTDEVNTEALIPPVAVSPPVIETKHNNTPASERPVRGTTVSESNQDLRDLIRIRVDACIQSAQLNLSPIEKVDEPTKPSQEQWTPRASASSNSSGGDVSAWEANLINSAFRNYRARVSSGSSASSVSSSVMNQAFYLDNSSGSSTASLPLRTSSASTVTTELLKKTKARSGSAPVVGSLRGLQKAIREEANFLANLFMQADQLDEDVLLIADSEDEDDEVFVREMRRQSLQLDGNVPQQQPPTRVKLSLDDLLASSQSHANQSQASKPGSVTADLLAGKLGNKVSVKLPTKQGPMKATVPLEAMTKTNAYIPLTSPNVHLATPTMGLSMNAPLWASTPLLSAATPKSASASTRTVELAKPMRRSLSSSSIPSPAKQPSPIVASGPVKHGLPSPKKRGIPPPKRHGIASPGKTGVLADKGGNNSGHGVPSKHGIVSPVKHGVPMKDMQVKGVGTAVRVRALSLPRPTGLQQPSVRLSSPKRALSAVRSLCRRSGKENVKP